MRIEHTDDPVPDEEDIYGVNDIDEYDPDYWMKEITKAELRRRYVRSVAWLLAVSFALAAILYFR